MGGRGDMGGGWGGRWGRVESRVVEEGGRVEEELGGAWWGREGRFKWFCGGWGIVSRERGGGRGCVFWREERVCVLGGGGSWVCVCLSFMYVLPFFKVYIIIFFITSSFIYSFFVRVCLCFLM